MELAKGRVIAELLILGVCCYSLRVHILLRITETRSSLFFDRDSGFRKGGFTRCSQVRSFQANCGTAI
jgi:hypothetical protein